MDDRHHGVGRCYVSRERPGNRRVSRKKPRYGRSRASRRVESAPWLDQMDASEDTPAEAARSIRDMVPPNVWGLFEIRSLRHPSQGNRRETAAGRREVKDYGKGQQRRMPEALPKSGRAHALPGRGSSASSYFACPSYFGPTGSGFLSISSVRIKPTQYQPLNGFAVFTQSGPPLESRSYPKTLVRSNKEHPR
jgi:hypothetical protein